VMNPHSWNAGDSTLSSSICFPSTTRSRPVRLMRFRSVSPVMLTWKVSRMWIWISASEGGRLASFQRSTYKATFSHWSSVSVLGLPAGWSLHRSERWRFTAPSEMPKMNGRSTRLLRNPTHSFRSINRLGWKIDQ
jgi:hypothetical protein